jgi:hypothetical protein
MSRGALFWDAIERITQVSLVVLVLASLWPIDPHFFGKLRMQLRFPESDPVPVYVDEIPYGPYEEAAYVRPGIGYTVIYLMAGIASLTVIQTWRFLVSLYEFAVALAEYVR